MIESFSAIYCSAKSLFGVASGSVVSSFLHEESREILIVKNRIKRKFFLDIFLKSSARYNFLNIFVIVL